MIDIKEFIDKCEYKNEYKIYKLSGKIPLFSLKYLSSYLIFYY